MNAHDPARWPAISRLVWETRYRMQGEAGIGDTWSRVASAVAAAEGAAREYWAGRFRAILDGFAFLPGGRILAGAGTRRNVTLFNCFVMGSIEDSLPGIFRALEEGALTMQQGGGVGYDFSTLRPAGTPAAASGGIASGPVSFMHIWDAMCATMLSTGARRGAMMATLRCDHPDIGIFIDAKRDPAALRHFNLSVQVTDEFMDCVQRGTEWPLVFPTAALPGAGGALLQRPWPGAEGALECRVVRVVPARQLWEQLMRAAYDTAEPGVLFIDRVNMENNLHRQEYLTATNPCGEIPLPPYGACNLGSLNLTAFVLDAFEPGARLDMERLLAVVGTAVRFMDNVIDLSKYPLAAQARVSRRSRRLGLGITGLGDTLAMLGQRYDSWTARGLAEDVVRRICATAYVTSARLAAERGPFPAYDRDELQESAFFRRLPSNVRAEVAANGLRNSHLLAIAPAGTISLLAGNVSSGIEPIFAHEARRRVLAADGSYQNHTISDFAWDLWQKRFPGLAAPDTLIEAAAVKPLAHLGMQAALQPWVDSAISKTINVDPDIRFDDFRDIYASAHRLGLKGCTVFRPNAIRGDVLSAVTASADASCCGMEREAD